MEAGIRLTKIREIVEQELVKAGFDLENLFIEVDEDGNHMARIVVDVLPEALKVEEEVKIDEEFDKIMKGLS